MLNRLCFTFGLTCLTSVGVAQATTISSMMEVADKQGQGLFTITNNNDHRIFMNVSVTELQVTETGDMEKVPYARENISDWKLEVRPAKSVIDPKFEKDFRVSMKCGSRCDDSKDQAFQLAFVPTPYFGASEGPQNRMQIAVGFGAIFVQPGKEHPIDYQVTTQADGRLLLHNQGDSYFNATFSTCDIDSLPDSADRSACEKNAMVLSGRKLPITLPKSMQGKPVQLQLSTSYGRFREQVTLKGEG